MIYFLEILSWFFIGFGLITAAVKYLNYSTPKHYLTWFGGVVFLGLIISQLILLPVPSTVLGNLENIIQIISGNVFYRIIYLLVSISLWTFWGLIIWYILLRLVPRKFLTYLGFLVVIYLSVVSPYFLLLKARYQISDWNVVLTDLISHISLQKSLWQWITEIIIPISIPISIALWGWWNQKEQRKITEQQKNEDKLKLYFDEVSNLLLSYGSSLKDQDQIIKNDKRLSRLLRIKTLMLLQSIESYTQGKRQIVQFLISIKLVNEIEVDLSEADLSHTNLDRLILQGYNLSHADLSHSSLDFTDLSFSNLQFSNLDYCSIRGSNLTSTNLANSTLRKADLSSIIINKSSNRGNSSTDLSYSDLAKADLHGATLVGAILSHSNLDFANLAFTNLTNANLDQASLNNTIFKGSRVIKAVLEKKYMKPFLSIFNSLLLRIKFWKKV